MIDKDPDPLGKKLKIHREPTLRNPKTLKITDTVGVKKNLEKMMKAGSVNTPHALNSPGA